MSGIRIILTAIIVVALSGAAMSQEKPTINVTSNNQQGGITAYQVNIGRVDLTFTESVANAIAGKLPTDRPVDVKSVGSERDQNVALQYVTFLQSKGFTIRALSRSGQLIPQPDNPVSITVFPDHSFVLISPRS